MTRVLALVTAGLLIASTHGCAPATKPEPSPRATTPTARALLHEAIACLSKQPLGRERVEWQALEARLASGLPEDAPAHDAHAAIVAAVAALGDPHARFIPSQPISPQTTAATAADAPAPGQPTIPMAPEGRLLDDGVAYLVVAGCSAPDVEGLRAYARAGAIEIRGLAAANPRGWLVDLRLNGGGNVWPMLLALRPLLGNGPCMTMVDPSRVQCAFGVSPEAGAWMDWGTGPTTQLDWGTDAVKELAPPTAARVAVLLGPWTMSSGESIAISFSGIPRARSFGEPTAGLTTVNNYYPLADGSILNLPVAYMGTRDGVALSGPVSPDVRVPFDNWPSSDDAPARAARAWLLSAPPVAASP